MKTGAVTRVIVRGRGGAPNRMAVHCRGASSCSVLRQLSPNEPEERDYTTRERRMTAVSPKVTSDSIAIFILNERIVTQTFTILFCSVLLESCETRA